MRGQSEAWLLWGYHRVRGEEVSEDWGRANAVLVCEKKENESLGNQRLASFILVTRKILLKIIKQSIYKYLDDNKIIKTS